MKLYTLEGRKKEGRKITTEHTIGIFKTPQKAREWIKKEGQNFYNSKYKRFKNHFYALCLHENLNTCDGYLYATYNKDGK